MIEKHIEASISSEALLNDSDLTQRYSEVKTGISEIERKRIGLSAELELRKKLYDQKVKELEGLGITDIQNLPEILESLKKEFESKLKEAEELITQANLKLGIK